MSLIMDKQEKVFDCSTIKRGDLIKRTAFLLERTEIRNCICNYAGGNQDIISAGYCECYQFSHNPGR